MKLLQAGARIDPELVDEHTPPRLVGLQRFRLAARAVEREHQLAAQPLAEGISRQERFQLGDEIGQRAEREIGLDPVLDRGDAKLLEASDL